jgi:phosphatidylinositol-3-phosphatase
MRLLMAIALAAAVALAAGGCGGGSSARSGGGAATSGGLPATTGSAPPASSAPAGSSARLDHVVWIVLENHGYSQTMDVPFFADLARRYGLASNLSAITHPSLPNYLALSGGSTFGVEDDAGPEAHPIAGPSIFTQVRSRGLIEAMPGPCSRADTSVGEGGYSAHHNPYVYFPDAASACRTLDVPYTSSDVPDLSAPFTLVVPDKCNDAHNCDLSVAGQWVGQFLERARQTPAWRDQRTAVVVTFDEDDHHEDNHIYTVVVSNQVHQHVEDATQATLYTILGTTEDLLGVPRLRSARGAGSIADLFVAG